MAGYYPGFDTMKGLRLGDSVTQVDSYGSAVSGPGNGLGDILPKGFGFNSETLGNGLSAISIYKGLDSIFNPDTTAKDYYNNQMRLQNKQQAMHETEVARVNKDRSDNTSAMYGPRD